jgi:hypothetical protein
LEEAEDLDIAIRLWESGLDFESLCESHGSSARPLPLISEPTFYKLFFRYPYSQLAKWFLISNAVAGKDRRDIADQLDTNYDESGGEILCRLMGSSSYLAQVLGKHLQFDHSAGSLISFFKETSFISSSKLQSHLDQALVQGLPTTAINGKRRFDFHLTSNWLRRRTPFFEDLLKESLTRNFKTPSLSDPGAEVQVSMRYTGKYQISLDEGTFNNVSVEGVFNVPLPVNCACQRDVKLVSCYPPDLLEHIDSKEGIIKNYEWCDRGRENVLISYDFECTVDEVLGYQSRGVENDPPNPLHDLSTEDLILDEMKLKMILRQIRPSTHNSVDAANQVYLWVSEHTSFGTKGFSSESILETGIGNCVDRTHLFIMLCRMLGIPARDRCGAPLQYASSSGSVIHATQTGLGFSPLDHTWAEVWNGSSAWLPVEFLGQSFGHRSLSRWNVCSSAERDRLVSDTAIYDRYYFGNLDPYRVHIRRPERHASARIRTAENHLSAKQVQLRMRHALTLEGVKLPYTRMNETRS